MTRKIVVAVASTTQAFATGTVAQGIRIALSQGGAELSAQMLSVAPYQATFEAIAPGDYVITAQTVDTNGVALGEPVTGAVTVSPDDTVAIDVPASLSIQVL